MVYHKCNNKKGFSLVELIVVIGIVLLFIALSDVAYSNFKSYSNLKIATADVVEALRYAKTNGEGAKYDSKWGVEILSSKVIIFEGSSYATRITSADQPLNFPSGVVASGTSEFVFEKMTGTTNVGTITLTNSGGGKKYINK